MKKLLLIIVILFVSISAVSASQSADDFNVSSVDGEQDMGSVTADDSDVCSGGVEHDDVSLVDDDLYLENESDASQDDSQDKNGSSKDVNNASVSKKTHSSNKVKIKGKDLVAYYKSKPVYKFTIVNSSGKPVSGLKVKITFDGKSYTKKTNKKGIVSLKLPAKVGKYNIKLTYKSFSLKKNIHLFKSRTFSQNLQSVYGKTVNYKLRVIDNNGKAMKAVKVIFKVDKKTYYKKTDSKGYAILKLNYAAGCYLISYSVDKLSGMNKYVVKNRITLKILNWGLRGDVSNAPLIYNNMPNNYWVKNAVKATKFGIPLLIIQGGNGKSVFMTSGVHGNELPSQVAMMRTIAYLTNKPVKGTVYIIPFVNVKAINQHVRLTNYDFNRVAHVPGTVSNNIIKLILHYKCDSYGDFHSTERPGDPGENIILGYKYPAKGCIPLTNYLAKSCNVNKKFYNYAGQVYRWSLADYANSKGTPVVICEVISKVNTLVPARVNLSYRMINQFLVYNRIL
ncbi:succinylglutamate desuccinylase/aspartoacylase family protein [Methanobrevibacter sp.]|uniref:succinylglutamate desuccinylase/aspartoacylase domain-containing protein n=1 Tax=Methanobrevibacter sp. TaxID=66852 RepID=UPI0026E02222|nr:succinylglutamate desuccinylase/aspartoacylase family protein [Methanobrevibacter sp.]MDO5859517.1 succinylglutamate desuccinylase/aspartoacylase family protein [Methanobrevibacter sp.]